MRCIRITGKQLGSVAVMARHENHVKKTAMTRHEKIHIQCMENLFKKGYMVKNGNDPSRKNTDPMYCKFV